jgi:hypothetical protein
MKNQPNPSQRWKLPVKSWIRELHEERFGVRPKAVNCPTSPAHPSKPSAEGDIDEDIPF